MPAALPRPGPGAPPATPSRPGAVRRLLGRLAARPRRARGTALLLVVTSIAVVTALTVDLAYNTRVSVQLAANARDDLKAYYLAKSAVNLSRFILNFQTQLDRPMTGSAGQQRAVPLAGLQLSIRLWDIVPVNSGAMAFLGGRIFADSGAPGGPRDDGADGLPTFGAFEGQFDAVMEDEDRKINVRQFDGVRPYHWAQTSRLAELVKDPKWDFLFDRDDANGLRVGRRELFAALKDWIDLDETGSAYTGNVGNPFDNGFGDENGLYDRLQDRYKAKNAPFDSLDELYLVAGVTDAFMAAFGDRLTVYPDVSQTINVNTDDPRELLFNAVVMAGGVLQPAMLDPLFLDRLRLALRLARPLPFLSLTPLQFAQVLQGLGVVVAPEVLAQGSTGVTSAFGDRSTTFRIKATGQAGDVKKTVDAVVTFDRRAQGLEFDLGRLLHWHEE